MAVEIDIFKFWLADTPTGLPYSLDINGLLQKLSIIPNGPDYALPEAPANWEDMQLSFGRNSHYWGINRANSTQFKFVRTAAKIIRQLLYGGSIETPISIIVCKWDPVLGYYRLYYKGQLDLSKAQDAVAEGITVPTLESGVIQLLKNYESMVTEIPCNGSLSVPFPDGTVAQNIKINADGLRVNDVFHYSIVPVTNNGNSVDVMPCVFVSNDGDNIGVIKGNQIFEDLQNAPNPNTFFQTSSNFVYSNVSATSVRIKGFIVVKPTGSSTIPFLMFTRSSLSQVIGSGPDFTNSYSLVPGTAHFYDSVALTGQMVFYFDRIISLIINESLFICFSGGNANVQVQIIGGSFSLSFTSQYPATRLWGITDYDLFRMIFYNINKAASTTNQPFNYQVTSSLLKNNPRLVNTSGDAIRASSDPNYYQYYNRATQNPANPGNQFFNQFTSLGPAIKTTLSDFFDSYNAYLNAALGNQINPDGTETIFLESKKYVLNPSMDPSNGLMVLSQPVTDLRVSLAVEYYWNWLKIGYNPQQYDEKAGKYEYNSLMQWQAPIKTLAKILSIISPYRADSYGFEYTRWNTQGGKSSTFNSNDNGVWTLSIDFTQFINDYYAASFISYISPPTSPSNTDQRLVNNQGVQPVSVTSLDGEYFTAQQDYSIFMFNQPFPGLQTLNVSFTAVLNGLVGDAATIVMYVNGLPVRTWTKAVTGVNTPFNITEPTFSRSFAQNDNIYFLVSTVNACTVDISTFTLAVGGTYFIFQNSGDINIPASSTAQLIPLPLLTPSYVTIGAQQVPVMSTGFQYFKFLSPVTNTNFDWIFGISGYHQGSTGQNVSFQVWKNGVAQGIVTYGGANNILTPFNPAPISGIAPTLFGGNITFALNDIVWITASSANINVWITNIYLKFTSPTIKAYYFYRPNTTGLSDNSAYSSIAGIPNPQTAFNIESLTPGRMLRANGSLLKSTLFNLAPNSLKWQTADKNQFLSTVLQGVTITENANIDIHDLDDPLFYPLLFEFRTEVPLNFADLMTGAANKHIQFTYKNKLFYGFPIQVTSKPAFNDVQEWKLLCSPATHLPDLYDLDWDGIPILNTMDAFIPWICPVHFVPLNYNKGSQYTTYTMDEDWFKNRITHWIDSNDYFEPWNTTDVISLQCQTNGLSPVQVQVMQCQNGVPVNIGTPISLPLVTNPAVQSPQTLYQGSFQFSAIPGLSGAAPDGVYYLLWTMGTGAGTASFISEPLYVRTAWDNTLLVQYTNSFNKLSAVFTGGYNPFIRVDGRIGRYTAKNKFTTYVDQPQDINLLNFIGFDTWKLELGYNSGIPDYMERKMDRILGLDTVLIEGNQYSRDADAQFERKVIDGEPKIYLSIDIRRAKNAEGITLNTAGQLGTSMPAGYTLDAGAFGQNGVSGSNLIQVTNS